MSLPFWNTWAISKELKIALVNKQNDEVTDVLLLVVLESLPTGVLGVGRAGS